MVKSRLPLLQGALDPQVLGCLFGAAQYGYPIAPMVREQTARDDTPLVP
jgi:hypothetical protein